MDITKINIFKYIEIILCIVILTSSGYPVICTN